MPRAVASTKRADRRNARIGKEQWRASSAPEQTSNSSGVIRRKLSRLTRTISTSRGRLQSRSRWRAVVTPPKPPPRITIRVFRDMGMSDLLEGRADSRGAAIDHGHAAAPRAQLLAAAPHAGVAVGRVRRVELVGTSDPADRLAPRDRVAELEREVPGDAEAVGDSLASEPSDDIIRDSGSL